MLADSSLGIITVTMEEFIELFGSSGYVLVVSKFEINGSVNGTVLTRDQMKSITGTGLVGDFISWGWNTITSGVEKAASVVTSVGDRFLGNNPIWTAAKNFGRTVWRGVKYYGNSAVSYVKRYGVVNTVRRAVDTINTKLRYAGQKIYTSVNNFLQNQYTKIANIIKNPYLPGLIKMGAEVIFDTEIVLIATKGASLIGSKILPILGPVLTAGDTMLYYRDHFVPTEKWGSSGIHEGWLQGKELRRFKLNGVWYYQEIPKNPDGTLNHAEAITYKSQDTLDLIDSNLGNESRFGLNYNL